MLIYVNHIFCDYAIRHKKILHEQKNFIEDHQKYARIPETTRRLPSRRERKPETEQRLPSRRRIIPQTARGGITAALH